MQHVRLRKYAKDRIHVSPSNSTSPSPIERSDQQSLIDSLSIVGFLAELTCLPVTSCLLPYASKAAAEGGILDDIYADLEALAIDIPNIVDPVLLAAFQVAKNQGRKISFIFMCVSFGILAYDQLPSVLSFPPTATTPDPPETVVASTTTGCPPDSMITTNQVSIIPLP